MDRLYYTYLIIKESLDYIPAVEIKKLLEENYQIKVDIKTIYQAIRNINELSKFKKKILFYSRLNNEDFEVTLDDSVDTLTDTSIKLLKEGKSKVLKFPENSSNNK